MSYPTLIGFPISMEKGLKKHPNFDGTVFQSTAAAVGNSAITTKPYCTWDFEFDMDAIQGNESEVNSVIAEFMAVFMQCQGRTNLFLFRDPQDNYVQTMQFGTGNGTTVAFQLSRGIGGATDIIQNVDASTMTPQIYVNSVLQSSSNYGISSTGIVTFNTAPSSGAIIAWTGYFLFLCRFAEDTVSSIRSFTTNNGTDQWNVEGIKFSSEFVASSSSGSVFSGGGSSGSFTPATPLAVQLTPSGSQTITGYPLFVTGLGSESSNPLATSGFLTLSKSDTIGWRNNANTGNLAFGINGSDQLTFNGVVLVSGQLPNTFNAVTNEFLTSYNASTGNFTAAQPAFSNISGTVTNAQLANDTVGVEGDGTVFSSSAVNIVLGSSGALSLLSQSANLGLFSPNGSSGTPTFRAMVTPDMPTSGTWAFAGTFSGNYTATGNGLITGTETHGLASYTSGVSSSPQLIFAGSYESASTPTYAEDSWTIQNVVGTGVNGTSTLTFTHSGTTGTAAVSIPSLNVTSTFTSISGNAVSSSSQSGVPIIVYEHVQGVNTANLNSGSAITMFTPSQNTQVRVTASIACLRAATSSSTTPSLTVGWTDAGGVARTYTLVATNTGNSTSVFTTGTMLLGTNSAAAVTITCSGYASSGGTTMEYSAVITCEVM